MSYNDKSIGGYFELELAQVHSLPFKKTYNFQSARAALVHLLKHGNPPKIWIPRMICNAITSSINAAGFNHEWYDINEDFSVDSNFELGAKDWILYVNYFGLCQDNVENIIKRFNPNQIVFDYSQAFYAPIKTEALATILSPRKFFGIPDGGLLITNENISMPTVRDKNSLDRFNHLIIRLDNDAEDGYIDYIKSEKSLEDYEPKQMSFLTEKLTKTIDYNAAKIKRSENFQHIHNLLSCQNAINLDFNLSDSPMCYPFLVDNKNIRDYLIKNKIYVPRYWPEVLNNSKKPIYDMLVNNIIPLPIDQRYQTHDIDYIAKYLVQ